MTAPDRPDLEWRKKQTWGRKVEKELVLHGPSRCRRCQSMPGNESEELLAFRRRKEVRLLRGLLERFMPLLGCGKTVDEIELAEGGV